MKVFWTITRNAFKELTRQPIFLVLMVSSSIFMLFLASLYYAGAEEDASMVHGGVLATLFITGLLSAVLGATVSIDEEVESGTALAVLSKPVGRLTFILAKFTGLAGALTLQCLCGALSALLASRMAFDVYGSPDYPAILIMASSIMLAFTIGLAVHFFLMKPFVGPTVLAQAACMLTGFVLINFLSRQWEPQSFGMGLDTRMIRAVILIIMALWLVGGIAIACSTRLSMIPTLVVCLALFLAGLVSDHFLGNQAESGSLWASLLYGILPNWQLFWMADALALKKNIPLAYILGAFQYAVGGLVMTLGAASLMFEHRELK